VSWFRKRIDRVRYLWRMALEENNDPKKFAFAVAVGVMVSASPVPPILGLRSGASIGGAWITKCNKLTAWLSSHVFAGPLWVLAAMLEVRLGSFILQRPQPLWGHTAGERLAAARGALLAWWIGGIILSPMFAFVAYCITRPIARKYLERKARRQKELDEELPESASTPGERLSKSSAE
jgi:uncharacterized protein (DUF2062 family)